MQIRRFACANKCLRELQVAYCKPLLTHEIVVIIPVSLHRAHFDMPYSFHLHIDSVYKQN